MGRRWLDLSLDCVSSWALLYERMHTGRVVVAALKKHRVEACTHQNLDIWLLGGSQTQYLKPIPTTQICIGRSTSQLSRFVSDTKKGSPIIRRPSKYTDLIERF